MGITVKRTFDGTPRAYRADYEHLGHKRAMTFPTRDEAEAFLRAVKKAAAERKVRERERLFQAALSDPATAPLTTLTLADVLEWHAQRSSAVMASQIRLAKRQAGDALVCELSDDWCRDLCERLLRREDGGTKGGTLARMTIAQTISLIKTACARKADELGVPRVPLPLGCDHLPASKMSRSIRERGLREGEEALARVALAHRAGQAEAPAGTRARHCQLAFDFAIETCGARSETLLLPWSEIDEASAQWRLPAERSKSGHARTIALSDKALSTLRELREDKTPGNPLVFHRLPRPEAFERLWSEAMANAGIEDLRFGDLRYEGLKRRLGGASVDAGKIAKELGRSPKTARRYTAARPDADALERARAFVETYAQLRTSFRATKPGSPARARIVAHMDALLEKRQLEGALSAADADAARAAFPNLPSGPRRL